MRLLFLHGAGLTKAMWTPQLEALTDEFDVAAIDLPGHGSRAGERFSFPAALDVVSEAVDDGALLIGLSLGGYVATLAAAERPQLTRGLVLTGSSVDYSRGRDRFVAWTGELFERAWPKRMLANAQRSAFERRYPDVPEVAQAGQYWRGYADALRAARKIHWHGKLDGYPEPVLILNGSLDKTHVREADGMIAGAVNGRTRVVEGAGHLANLDRPDEYTAALREHAASAKS